MNIWKVWIEKFRTRRLGFTFAILATLSAGILIGSVVAHGVDGKETKVDSSDAQPLQVPNPVNLSTTFTKIAKEVGPAVVNINTVSYPKNAPDTEASRARTTMDRAKARRDRADRAAGTARPGSG